MQASGADESENNSYMVRPPDQDRGLYSLVNDDVPQNAPAPAPNNINGVPLIGRRGQLPARIPARGRPNQENLFDPFFNNEASESERQTQRLKNMTYCYLFFILFMLITPIDDCNTTKDHNTLPAKHLINEKCWIMIYFAISFV